ncbi:queuosine-tRNA galactosyltransferase-like [Ornithodoros turicata]|uniref:queuosine-tRNA galactosyltransferase-like n=1 Tax=Ornithodoros turicata TaxID=34597 RepID=UPI0031390381
MRRDTVDVTIVVPLHNGEPWIDECLSSVIAQDFQGSLELSIYNDSSTDRSLELVEKWRTSLEQRKIVLTLSSGDACTGPKGVGAAKNRAVHQSCGRYLCFLDIDDIMGPERISSQYTTAIRSPSNTIVGSKFNRIPEGSTERYTVWANNLEQDKLDVQIFTSHGPTIIMPTWFCDRAVFEAVGGFDERGKGIPEDLIFFYKHLDLGGKLLRVDRVLLTYRYHQQAATFSVLESTIWDVRLDRMQRDFLSRWTTFTIWNAGKQGRRFYRALCKESRKKVVAFCDVDEKKIAKKVYIHEESEEVPRPRVPIIHFLQATAPLVICMKLDLTGGGFERNLSLMNLEEGKDYILFS